MLQSALHVMHLSNVQSQFNGESTAAQAANISCLDVGM